MTRRSSGRFHLDMDKRRLILDRYYRINSLNHYEVLGVQSNVERKTLKSKYYELVAAIHPDRHSAKHWAFPGEAGALLCANHRGL